MLVPNENPSSEFQVRDWGHFAKAIHKEISTNRLGGSTTIHIFEGSTRRRYQLPSIETLALTDIVRFDVLQENEGSTLLRIYLPLTSEELEIGTDGNSCYHQTVLSFVFCYEHPQETKDAREIIIERIERQVEKSCVCLLLLFTGIVVGGFAVGENIIKDHMRTARLQNKKEVPMREPTVRITPPASHDPLFPPEDPFELSPPTSHTAP